jgi:class 3 adenylate cyclase/tetratricopeptide (TPR) repeat protein
MDFLIDGFIAMDRRQVISLSQELPERAHGAVLLADLSGFTPLTERLATAFGPHRGAEELTGYLNLVHNALSEKINLYRGSVIGFSGDGVTCWFDDQSDEPPGLERAVTAALAMQGVMQQVSVVQLPNDETITLAMKVAVASGGVRRFLVGDPDIQLIDVLAGNIMERVAVGEHLAGKGEVLLDAVGASRLQDELNIVDWQVEAETGDRFAVIGGFHKAIQPNIWPPPDSLDQAQVIPWLLPAMRDRLRQGQGEFLTELRPGVALFLHFEGIDFEGDAEACAKLDAYVHHVQEVLARYEALLVQLTIGEKGSYLYAAFGAPVAHEDDVLRAVSVALELRSVPHDYSFIQGVQIGLSQGTMRVGVYGSTTRRTYGVLGDEVNLAARLMQHAGSGEVLGSGRVQANTAEVFSWQSLPPLQVKGKKKPVARARLLGRPQVLADAVGFTGEYIENEDKLDELVTFIRPLQDGKFSGAAYLYGEPGIGKSRLAYELQQRLRRQHRVSWFTCSADRILRQSLYPFKHFLREYFDQYVRSTEEDNKTRFTHVYESLLNDPAAAPLRKNLEEGRSFLGAMVDLFWEKSPYEMATPRARFAETLAAFRTLIEAESLRQPVVLQIEDAHWLDSDSQILLNELIRHTGHFAWGVVINSRYLEEGHTFSLELDEAIPQKILHLEPLSPNGIYRLTAQVLGGGNSAELVELITVKAGGNPFFIQNLVLDMRERGILVKDAQGDWQIAVQDWGEVPASINAVLVARLDRLPPQQKAVVQVAAVLGQAFELSVLAHMIQTDISETVRQVEAEGIWTVHDAVHVHFRHSLLRDAAYEMQSRSRLAELHARAGEGIEKIYYQDLSFYAADLTYHYGMAGDIQRERHFARLAGENAAAQYANAEALSYLNRALTLTPSDEQLEQYGLLLTRESVYDLQGNRAAQWQDLETLSRLANALDDNRLRAEVALRHANYAEVTSSYADASASAEQAVTLAQYCGAQDIEAAGWLARGRALGWQGQYESAVECLRCALTLSKAQEFTLLEAACLRNLGIVAYAQGDYQTAHRYQHNALHLSRAVGDRRGESNALHNLGQIARDQNDWTAAQNYQEQALNLSRETGDRRSENSVLNVSQVGLREQSYEEKQLFYQQALQLSREINNRRGEANALLHLGNVAFDLGNYDDARPFYEQALNIAQSIGFRRGEIRTLTALGRLHYMLGDYETAADFTRHAIETAEETGDRPEQANVLMIQGHVLLGMNQLPESSIAYTHALQLRKELGQNALVPEAQSGLVRIALVESDMTKAQRIVDEILGAMAGIDLEAMEEPLEVLMVCFRVLQSIQDFPHARAVLESAYQILQNRLKKIGDAERKRIFLEKIPVHRELMTAWAWANQR